MTKPVLEQLSVRGSGPRAGGALGQSLDAFFSDSERNAPKFAGCYFAAPFFEPWAVSA